MTLGLAAQGYYWYEQGLVDHNSFQELFDAILQMPFKEQALYAVQAYLLLAFTLKLITGLLFFQLFVFYPMNAALIILQWSGFKSIIEKIQTKTFTTADVEMTVELVGPIVSLLGVMLASFTPFTQEAEPQRLKGDQFYIRV